VSVKGDEIAARSVISVRSSGCWVVLVVTVLAESKAAVILWLVANGIERKVTAKRDEHERCWVLLVRTHAMKNCGVVRCESR
jgi:uncharacterized protein YybS (DUF2232 family)